jgi:hypothetical protein
LTIKSTSHTTRPYRPAKTAAGFSGFVNATFFALAPAALPLMRINLCFVNARQYSIVKDQKSCLHLAISFQRKALRSASRELIADC